MMLGTACEQGGHCENEAGRGNARYLKKGLRREFGDALALVTLEDRGKRLGCKSAFSR
jgi:hypothetical protein